MIKRFKVFAAWGAAVVAGAIVVAMMYVFSVVGDIPLSGR